jgi:hypothetical protein
MTKPEYHYALCLIDASLALFSPRGERPAVLRRRLRALTVEFALLRVRVGQPARGLWRN